MIQRFYSPSKQGFYSDDAHPTPADRPDDCIEITDEQWQDLLEANQSGEAIVYEDGVITTKSHVLTMDDIRASRDKKLRASDWTQGRDVPEALSQQWASYRQALRDLPEVYDGSPEDVVWPQQPQ